MAPRPPPVSGVHVSRHLIAITAALLLVVLLAPAALAAEGEDPTATGAAPTPTLAPEPEPEPEPEPTETPGDGNGEIVIDPTFVTPSSTPAGQVKGAQGTPQPTPPSTDAVPAPAAPGSALPPLLLLLGGGSAVALVVGSLPARRPRRVRR